MSRFDEYVQHGGLNETEAESVANVVAAMAGTRRRCLQRRVHRRMVRGGASVIRAAVENVMLSAALVALVDESDEQATAAP